MTNAAERYWPVIDDRKLPVPLIGLAVVRPGGSLEEVIAAFPDGQVAGRLTAQEFGDEFAGDLSRVLVTPYRDGFTVFDLSGTDLVEPEVLEALSAGRQVAVMFRTVSTVSLYVYRDGARVRAIHDWFDDSAREIDESARLAEEAGLEWVSSDLPDDDQTDDPSYWDNERDASDVAYELLVRLAGFHFDSDWAQTPGTVVAVREYRW
jgi:hypothetical protein